MTESEWMRCNDPDEMLEFLESKVSDRKLRLFACACCRRIWHMLNDEHCRWAVETAERYADGRARKHELRAARFNIPRSCVSHQEAARATLASDAMVGVLGVLAHSVEAVHFETAITAGRAGMNFEEARGVADNARSSVLHQVLTLLRDIFKPFCPSRPFPPSVLTWNDSTVRRIAEGIYEERKMPEGTFDTGRMAILHDALLDAGCTDEAILSHCRSHEDHVRGCWVVDLILGKK